MEKTRLTRIEKHETNKLLNRLKYIDFHHLPVYRFFQEKWQAEALLKGNIWLSTLEVCRKYENPDQGDKFEATQTYNSGVITGDSDCPDLKKIAARCDFIIPTSNNHSRKITFKNSSSTMQINDAFVLCTAKEYVPGVLSKSFGQYCVKINDPIKFYRLASIALHQQTLIRDGAMGCIQYKSREYSGLDNVPGQLGFIKPYSYHPQKEFRFIWLPLTGKPIQPMSIYCPEIVNCCEMM